MAMDFERDLSRFIRELEGVTEDIGLSARRRLEDVMDDWKRKSVDVAPLDKGTLRRGIDTDINGQGIDLTGEIISVAIENSQNWPRFNYAYYIHSKGEIRNPTTPGTIAKYLEDPATQNEERWKRMIEREIEQQVRRRGW